ncbi:hypothetical protein [Paraburkholderia silvatlantica]|uniref:Uncharacterized protein n=1 Tax=Paraburkholderia silvatlantica TaxID=321895 RepID=A0ABR6FZ64_9BURK|nr:hypothetical protein [Paraburkholderia silvatlantica]MBB2932719.1 hypothetical protein [Paraburkholderia silvatlantica]PVY21469.1 hypothetical protein C7411_13644 [Paraburkholderia silvatlantica]PXW26066.1 hypothetical protein C7413_13744 [Paraburkholderia silvatlantica]
MSTKGKRTSPEQWAKLDAALHGLHERPPPETSPSLTREISRRADILREALQSGWRVRDLAVFFRESAGIDVSPNTIQEALRRALEDATSDRRRARAKRPRRKTASTHAGVTKTAATGRISTPQAAPRTQATIHVAQPDAHAQPSGNAPALGSTLTPGATRRGQR